MKQYFVKYKTIGRIFNTGFETNSIITVEDDLRLSDYEVREAVLKVSGNKVYEILDINKL